MFPDLVGSTALSARMDPEDLREVISSYQRCVTETVRRFGGFVCTITWATWRWLVYFLVIHRLTGTTPSGQWAPD